MKKFYTYGIENTNLEKPINESFGTLILGLLTVLGITLMGAIRSCANSYDTEPGVDPEDIAKAQEELNKYNKGTKRTYDEMLAAIEEAKKQEEENKKNKDKKDGDTPPPLPGEKNKDKRDGDTPPPLPGEEGKKDGDKNSETNLKDLDPEDNSTKQIVDNIEILSICDEALAKGSQKEKLNLLFDYIKNTGAAQKALEEDKSIKNKTFDEDTINHVISNQLLKLYMTLRTKDKKYIPLFKDVNIVSGIQELICFQMIKNNEQKTSKLEKGTYTNLGKILEIL